MINLTQFQLSFSLSLKVLAFTVDLALSSPMLHYLLKLLIPLVENQIQGVHVCHRIVATVAMPPS